MYTLALFAVLNCWNFSVTVIFPCVSWFSFSVLVTVSVIFYFSVTVTVNLNNTGVSYQPLRRHVRCRPPAGCGIFFRNSPRQKCRRLWAIPSLDHVRRRSGPCTTHPRAGVSGDYQQLSGSHQSSQTTDILPATLVNVVYIPHVVNGIRLLLAWHRAPHTRAFCDTGWQLLIRRDLMTIVRLRH